MTEYVQSFFTVPYRIITLVGDNFAYLKIYEVIFQFWNKDRPCYISNKMIMERTGIKSQNTLKDAFKFFEQHGELKRKTVNGKRYFIQPERRIEFKSSTEGGNSGELGGSLHEVRGGNSGELHNNNKINNKKKNKSFRSSTGSKSAPVDDRFPEFWNLYPRKVGKKKAMKIWHDNGLDERADEILAKLATQIDKDEQWKEPKYIPHPATYLNQERWEDEIVENNAPAQKTNEPRSTVPWFDPSEREKQWQRERQANVYTETQGVSDEDKGTDTTRDQSGGRSMSQDQTCKVSGRGVGERVQKRRERLDHPQAIDQYFN